MDNYWKIIVVSVCVLLASANYVSSYALQDPICFPEGFAFGVATSSYQIEGAWNVSGKGENIWDRYTHAHPERVFDHSNGDTAADSYHHWKEDIMLLRDLGVTFYRFSLSWSRILPTGFSNEVNEDGIKYYNNLINELLSHNIAPVVTIYHWDLPQPLQDLGGWTNPMMADYFVDYATVLFDRLEGPVKMWITFNEPLSFCHDGYGGDDAPGGRSSGIETYMCGHNVLRAHGKVYKLFKERQKARNTTGWMGITLDFPWIEPATKLPSEQEAAETARQFMFGWFAHPIFSKSGDYPEVMRARIDEKSKKQNFARSRLPYFTREEVEYIKGSSDFLGLNHYTTYLAGPTDEMFPVAPTFENDMGVQLSQDPDWPTTNSTWLRVVPWGFRKALNWIKENYDNPRVVVTENGISLPPGLEDAKRIEYICKYLKSLHDAIMKDKCRVLGYTYWSLIDNFEWMRGYSERFGLYEVLFNRPLVRGLNVPDRSPRRSASFYAQLSRTLCVPDQYLHYAGNDRTYH